MSRARWIRERSAIALLYTKEPGDEATGLRRILVGEAEWLTLAPGARVPVGLPVGSGAPEARPLTVQWTATVSHTKEARDPMRVLEQGPDRQRSPDA